MHRHNAGSLPADREPAQPDQRVQPDVAGPLMSSGQTKHTANVAIRLSRAKLAAAFEPALALGARMRHIKAVQAPSGVIAMAYALDQFISDCRSILAGDPGPKGREQVRSRLERLLQNPDFVRAHCEEAPRGLHVLYEDPQLGFQVLAHINDKARTSPPHDHGASWAIYGQATHYTDMIEWEREGDGQHAGEAQKRQQQKPVKKSRPTPGHAGIYQDGTIHSIDYPDSARFVRVTGTNLDKIERVRFDLASGKVEQMTPQQAT